MDCVLYARISSDRTGQEAGVTRQVEDTRALAVRHGDHVVAEIIDNDVSAYARKPRPGYRQVVDMVKSRTVQSVYVWHPIGCTGGCVTSKTWSTSSKRTT
jgi:site-specific DNA recombinase